MKYTDIQRVADDLAYGMPAYQYAAKLMVQWLRRDGISTNGMKYGNLIDAMVAEELLKPIPRHFSKRDRALSIIRQLSGKKPRKAKSKRVKRPEKSGRTYHPPTHHPDATSNATQAAVSEFYASYDWRRLRWATLKRYGRVCQACGARPPEVTIHVDHIKPLRFFWDLRLDPENLQVLCEVCNHGKGAWDRTDVRA